MALAPLESRVPALIGDLELVVTDKPGVEMDSATVSVQVLEADGALFTVLAVNVVPYLTSDEITAMVALMARVRALAETELIP